MDFTITFIKLFSYGVFLISPLLLLMCFIMVILGLIVGRMESWSRFDSVYWSFVTGLTVGYGDIRPQHKKSRVLAIVIAWIGILLAGLVVAITVQAASIAFKMHIVPDVQIEIHREIGNLTK